MVSTFLCLEYIEGEYQMDLLTVDRHSCPNIKQDISFKKDVLLRQTFIELMFDIVYILIQNIPIKSIRRRSLLLPKE